MKGKDVVDLEEFERVLKRIYCGVDDKDVERRIVGLLFGIRMLIEELKSKGYVFEVEE